MKTPHLPFFAAAAWLAASCSLTAQNEPSDPLESVLHTVEASIELHEWLSLLDMTDPAHRQARLEAGTTHAALVAELLGLNFEGNTLAGEDGVIRQADLGRIRQVEWKRRKARGDGMTTVMGTAALHDGSVLLVEIHLAKDGESYLLTAEPDS